MESEQIILSWDLLSQNDSIESILMLEEALIRQDLNTICKLLQNPKLASTLVIKRGEDCYLMNLLIKSVESLLYDLSGTKNLGISESNALIQSYKLPYSILNELMAIAFHKSWRNNFFMLKKNIDNLFVKENAITIRASHDLSAWYASRDNNSELAINLSKQNLIYCQSNDLLILGQQVRFANLFNTNFGKKDARIKSERFFCISESMSLLGHHYNALRALQESANQLYLLSLKQPINDIKKTQATTLRFAEKRAWQSLRKAEEYSYSVGIIKSYEIIVSISGQLYKISKGKDKKQAASTYTRFKARYQDLKSTYRYLSC